MAEQTFYYRYSDGTLETRTTTDAHPEHPQNATLLSAAEYTTALGEVEEARQARLAAVQETERAAQQAAYEELLTAGMSDAVAQSLSGYTPPEPDPNDEPDPAAVA